MRQEALLALAASVLLAACANAVGIEDGAAIAGDAAAPDAHASQPDASSFPPVSPNGDDASVADPDAGSPLPDSGSSSACASKFSGTLVTFDFTADPGNQASSAAKSSAAGLTAGALTRSGGLTAVAGTGSINASNWATTSKLDPTLYYTFTLTPPAGCALDLTSMSIDSKSSGTGPTTGAVATSDDQFAKTATFTTGAVGTVSLSVSQATNAVELRVYGYGATGTSGTMRLQTTLSVSGALK